VSGAKTATSTADASSTQRTCPVLTVPSIAFRTAATRCVIGLNAANPASFDRCVKVSRDALSLSTVSNLAGSEQPHRRRADAERSIEAILEAAARVFGQQPHASIEEVAAAAGISRQTVYAHFPSREALLDTLLDRATARVMAALDAADLEAGSAMGALVRFLEIGWQAFAGDPFLLHLSSPPATAQEDRDRHGPVLRRLERVVTRGQGSGEFDPALSVSWILAATFGLGHAAGEEVRAGRMTAEDGLKAIRHGLPRLFSPDDPPATQ
jgi:AcrR family transcriptional regulator